MASPTTTTYTDYGDEDSRAYDFIKERKLHKTTNVVESMGHLVKGCLGAGMLGIHHAFMKCGLWTAVILNIAFGFYLSYCIHILVKSAQRLYWRLHVPAMSYSDLAQMSLESSSFPKLRKYGFCFRVMVDLCICIDLFGACCCYQIFIGKAIKQLVENSQETPIHGVGNSPDLRVYIFALVIPIILLCLIRNLKYLAPFTLAADFLILFSVGTTIYYSLQISPPLSEMPAYRNFSGLLEFAGVSIFSMEGVGVSLAIENNMTQPLRFPLVLLGGMGIVVAIVTTTGFFGYWGWGDNCAASITLNFPMGEIIPLTVKGLMAFMILVTYALNFWVPFNIIWYYLKKKHPEDKHWIWERVYRTIHVILITFIAAAFPNIGSFMGFLGSLCLSNMGFIYPAFIELVVDWKKPGLGPLKWKLWKGILIMVLGIIFCILGSYENGKKLFFSSH